MLAHRTEVCCFVRSAGATANAIWIVADYQAAKDDPAFDLEAFVLERFTLPSTEGITPPEGLLYGEPVQ